MEKHLDVTIKASYTTLNNLTPETRRIWMVFHGYGMLSRYFIRKFSGLDPVTNFIIAPQGLSRHYLEGFSGRVGASWMTREDRLTEIDNQISYLNRVTESEKLLQSGAEVILLGFSQGAATACRFGAYGNLSFDRLVLWAGGFPPDISRGEVAHWKPGLTITYFTGNQDPFFEERMIDEQNDLVRQATGREPVLVRFDGGHEIIPALLDQI